MISISKGLFRSVFNAVVFFILGVISLYFSIGGFVILYPFALALLVMSVCFTGFDFKTDLKKYREYYTIFGFKIGRWKSYEEYCFITYHAVILSQPIIENPAPNSNSSLSGFHGDTIDYEYKSFKLLLLNKTHTKKIFIKYTMSLDYSFF